MVFIGHSGSDVTSTACVSFHISSAATPFPLCPQSSAGYWRQTKTTKSGNAFMPLWTLGFLLAQVLFNETRKVSYMLVWLNIRVGLSLKKKCTSFHPQSKRLLRIEEENKHTRTKMEDTKYLPELLAEKDSLDSSFTHAMKLISAGTVNTLTGVRLTS